MGIRPTYPATGFGYVSFGEAWVIESGFRVYRSAGFTEKPDQATAMRFLEGGRHVWNSGMFVWRADRLMDEFASQLPETYAASAADRPGTGHAAGRRGARAGMGQDQAHLARLWDHGARRAMWR